MILLFSNPTFAQFMHKAHDIPRPCKEKRDLISSDSIIEAVRNGDMEKLAYYVEKRNMPLSSCDSKGNYIPLTAAVHFNQIKIFEYLILKGADPKSRDDWGTAACQAALYGRDSLLNRLLEIGVDPNEKTNAGSPLLSFAVSEARYSTVQILLAHGADTRIKNEDGDLPIDRAKKHKDARMIELLGKYENKKTDELK
jgi:uncharacterized protein